MVGKKNVVFGFLFLVATAALGPLMVVEYVPDVGQAQGQKQEKVGRLQSLQANEFEENLEPLPATGIAKANTGGILALNQVYNAEAPVNAIKGGPHAHGNLESLLNIVVGVSLGFLAVPVLFKQAISWAFIVGTVMHSGMLYLAVIFQFPWAGKLLGSGIGPVFILLGLLMAGIAAAMGFRSQLVQD